MRRVEHISHHVVAASRAAASEAHTNQSSATGDALAPPTPLSEDELAAYMRDGFWAAPIDSLPPSFHEEFGERMRGMWDAGDQGDQDWLSLEPALVQVLRSPTMNGAMQSILGPDYQMAAPWCNMPGQGGMIGLHVTGASTSGNDQSFHKDGTDHGNTQSTVRDLRNRQVIMMYYPLGASLQQGPTAVVPRSQHYALDRGERPGGSEIGLSADGPMPEDFAARDEWLQASADCIGGSVDTGFIDHRVEVPPGSVVICHHQLFHRASRSEEGYFRPMVKLGAARISEPRGGDSSAPAMLPGSSLQAAMWDYAQGRERTVDTVGVATDVPKLVATLQADPSDVQRMEAAHALADAAVAAGGSGAAMEALLDAFTTHLQNEAASRNAMCEYASNPDHHNSVARDISERLLVIADGLCAVGDAAVTPVCAVLAEAAVAGQTDTTGIGWKLACNAAHVLGQAATSHESQALALRTIAAAMAIARAEIDAHGMPEATDGHDYYAMERRRLLAEGSCSAGLIGHRGATADDETVALAALDCLMPVLTADEPAEPLPSFMWAGTVHNNAGCALLRLFSDARVTELSGPVMPVFKVNDDNKERMLAGSIRESLRRADVLCSAAPTQTRGAMRKRLASVDWQALLRVDAPLFEPL